MTASRRAALLIVAPLAVSACTALQRDAAAEKEDMLSAAGFTIRPVTTAVQADMLARLPPNRVSRKTEGFRVSYLYPDPVNCHCLYVGDQAAYGRYQELAIQRRIARDQVEAAQLNDDLAWDWGPWGGYGPPFY